MVLGVHHAGKDRKTLRGSSAFESGVDTVYSTSGDEGVIPLTREKRKDGPEHDHHVFKLDLIMGTKAPSFLSTARADNISPRSV